MSEKKISYNYDTRVSCCLRDAHIHLCAYNGVQRPPRACQTSRKVVNHCFPSPRCSDPSFANILLK